MNAKASRYKFGIRYKFSGSIDALETWLNSHCKGAFEYELADVHETETPFGQLDILFHFEQGQDRERFVGREEYALGGDLN